MRTGTYLLSILAAACLLAACLLAACGPATPRRRRPSAG
jgi:hypothetical protein